MNYTSSKWFKQFLPNNLNCVISFLIPNKRRLYMLYMLYMLQHYVNSVCVMFIQAFSVRCITYLITALDE